MLQTQASIFLENSKFNISDDLTRVIGGEKRKIVPSGMYPVFFKGRTFYIMRYIDTAKCKVKDYALLTKINGEFANVSLDDYDLFYEYAEGKSDFNAPLEYSFPSYLSSTQLICFRDLLDRLKFRKYTHHIVVPTIEDMGELILDSAFEKIKIKNNVLLCKDAMYKKLEEKLELLEEKIMITNKEGETGYIRSYDDKGYIRNKKVYLIPGKHVYIPEYIDCKSIDDYEESEKARVILMPNQVISENVDSAYCYNHDGSLIGPKLTKTRK